jgi:hypothetical protein
MSLGVFTFLDGILNTLGRGALLKLIARKPRQTTDAMQADPQPNQSVPVEVNGHA